MPEPADTATACSANLDGVLRLYLKSLPHCILPSLLLALVWSAWSAAMNRLLGTSDDPWQAYAQLQLLLSAAAFWRWSLLAAGLTVLLYGALLVNIAAVAMGAAVPGMAGLGKAARIFPTAVAGTLIFMTLTTIATLLLIIPGAYLWGMWQLWPVAMVAERAGPIASLRRSWQLVSGSWWHVTTLITAVTLTAVVPLLICDALLATLSGVAGLNAARSQALAAVAHGLLDVLLAPLLPVAMVASFCTLRGRSQRARVPGAV